MKQKIYQMRIKHYKVNLMLKQRNFKIQKQESKN